WPAGHLPLKGGDCLSSTPRQFFDIGNRPGLRRHLISPLEGEMAGRPEGGIKSHFGRIPQAALPQPLAPLAQRFTSALMRLPCSPSRSGPKVWTSPAGPSACTTSSGLPPKLPFGTSRKRGRPE